MYGSVLVERVTASSACYSVLQRVALCVVVCYSILQCSAVCRTVLQRVEYDDSTVATLDALLERTGMLQNVLPNAAGCLESESLRVIVSCAQLKFSQRHELPVWSPIGKWGKFVGLWQLYNLHKRSSVHMARAPATCEWV